MQSNTAAVRGDQGRRVEPQSMFAARTARGWGGEVLTPLDGLDLGSGRRRFALRHPHPGKHRVRRRRRRNRHTRRRLRGRRSLRLWSRRRRRRRRRRRLRAEQLEDGAEREVVGRLRANRTRVSLQLHGHSLSAYSCSRDSPQGWQL